MKSKLTFVRYEDINVDLGRNPRDADNYDIEGLSVDIEQNGIQTPIVVSLRQNGEYHLLRGHRRMLAIGNILSRNADFDVSKLPAMVYSDLTISEEVDLILDHSNQRNLTRKSELYRTAAALFRNGFSEMQVAIKCDPLFARFSVREPEGRVAALKLTNSAERASALKDCWRQRTQEIYNIVRMPLIVEETYLHQNGLPDEKGEFQMPKLTTARITKLYTAFLLDQKSGEKGDEYFGGKAFSTKWTEFVEEDKGKAKGEIKTVKRMAANDIEDRKALYRSAAVRNALSMVLGDDVELDKSDRVAAIAECIESRDPDLWSKCVARYDEIRAADRKKATESRA